jgi:hypothetical protein
MVMNIVNVNTIDDLNLSEKFEKINMLFYQFDNDVMVYISSLLFLKDMVYIVNRFLTKSDFNLFINQLGIDNVYSQLISVIKNSENVEDLENEITKLGFVIDRKDDDGTPMLTQLDYTKSEYYSLEPDNISEISNNNRETKEKYILIGDRNAIR